MAILADMCVARTQNKKVKKHSKRKIKLTVEIHGQKRTKTNEKRSDPSVPEGDIHVFGGETKNVTDKNTFFLRI